jgi:four helix bundle protein
MVTAVKSYRDLLVWQEAMVLAAQVYTLSEQLPDREKYELARQLRRAAVSIPSNIAEGYARDSAGSYANFLKIARGSLREIETQVLLAERLRLIGEELGSGVLDQCDKVGRLLHGLLQSIERHLPG